jgi:alkylation response protein AidB-like acyl-CoA dehydrogenase
MIRSFEDPRVDDFRAEAARWLKAHVPAAWADRFDMPEDERIGIRRDWERTLWEGGYTGISWPEAFGGRGLGPIEEVVYFQEAGRAHAPEELNVIGKYVAGPSIMINGTDEQRARYLPAILRGQEIWCEGYSEPDAGSDLAAVQTIAEPDGDTYHVHGHKIWTSNAHIADRCWLLARTSRELRRHHNLSMFLLDMHQDGISVQPIRQLTGEAHFNEVFFDGAVVTRADLVGEEHEGWRLATLRGQRAGRQVIAGALRRHMLITEWLDTLGHCVAGTPAAGRHRGLTTKATLLSWQVARGTDLLARDEDWFPVTSVLQMWWSELMQEITACGLEQNCADHRSYWRNLHLEALAATIYGGTSQIQRNVVASRVLGLPRAV